jgi:hypothetical protein
MKEIFVKAIEQAIEKVISDFQNNPNRYWNERDIHWNLFYYLKQEQVVQENYVTELIRAEFPTLKKFGKGDSDRGHYDLVILDSNSYHARSVQLMGAQSPWQPFLEHIELSVAIEIKLWLAKWSNLEERAKWDIQKLTEKPNNIVNAFFLNFAQLDFSRKDTQLYFEKLRNHLVRYKQRWPNLKILCVPSDKSILHYSRQNWL